MGTVCGTALLLVPRAGLLLWLHLMPDWQRELAHVPRVSWQQYLSSTELATCDFLNKKNNNLTIMYGVHCCHENREKQRCCYFHLNEFHKSKVKKNKTHKIVKCLIAIGRDSCFCLFYSLSLLDRVLAFWYVNIKGRVGLVCKCDLHISHSRSHRCFSVVKLFWNGVCVGEVGGKKEGWGVVSDAHMALLLMYSSLDLI